MGIFSWVPNFFKPVMDYREITKKDGKKIVFCRFEDLLKDFYGVGTMEEVEPHCNNNGEYIIHCPFCKAEGHTKHKLYIKSDLTVGNCFVCGRAYVNVTDKFDPHVILSGLIGNRNLLYGQQRGFSLVRLEDPTWSIDKFVYEFDDYDSSGICYLESRNPYLGELYRILGMKFWNGNVVIPFYDNKGEVFYYQIRFTNITHDMKNKIRYFMPPIKEKPPYIINRDGSAKRRLIICEGIFDAIACLIQAPDYTPVAVLGSHISDYQVDYLRYYYATDGIEEIKIWMDEFEISKRIKNEIKRKIDYVPISIIPSNGPDPEEIMIQRIGQFKNLQWINKGIIEHGPEYLCRQIGKSFSY